MTHNFQPWPKIARLNREIVITEKIDGTNAAIGIERVMPSMEADLAIGRFGLDDLRRNNTSAMVVGDEIDEVTGHLPVYWVWAQSRNRVITPGKSTDNAGFAAWVARHADVLVERLGAGLHFGEWWGQGIQRGYDLDHKNFSLFNTARHAGVYTAFDDGTELDHVPVLYQGMMSEEAIKDALADLAYDGSVARHGFMRPEGIIVYHTAASTMFKVTLEGDESPKGANRG